MRGEPAGRPEALQQTCREAIGKGRVSLFWRAQAAFPVSVHGGEPIRLDTDYNDATLRVADRLDVAVVDPRAVLDAEPAVYQDACHISAHGQARVAGDVRDFRTSLPRPTRKGRLPTTTTIGGVS